jgi:cysteine desulfurase / selenocysteine lyase
MTDYSEAASLAAASLPGGTLPGAGSLESANALQSGAPDPAWIAQLANSLFSEFPGGPLPAAGASQPTLPSLAADPGTKIAPGFPPFEPPLSPATAPGAPFTVPSSPGGASQPSAPVYVFETLPSGAVAPPSSPFGATVPSAPIFAYEPSRPGAWAPPSSLSGVSQPSAPIFAPEEAEPVPPPPSSFAGASQPSAPIFAHEKLRPNGATPPTPPTGPATAHPFGQTPGPNTVAPSPTTVGSGALDHPATAASAPGSPPSQAGFGAVPGGSEEGVLTFLPLIDPFFGSFDGFGLFGREATPQGFPTGGAPADDSYAFLDEARNGGGPSTLPSYARETFVYDSAAPLQPWQGVRPPQVSGHRAFVPQTFRNEFPILHQEVNGRPLIWLDNAATTQKPQSVIDRIAYFYARENSNVHRAAHTLAARSTDAYEAAREKVRRFLNAPSVKDIVFVRGTSEGINLISQSWGRRNVGEGDEIVLTHLEHHSNIVPWQLLAAETGAKIRVAPVDDTGQVLIDEYEKLLNPRTRIVAFTHVSNALGTITPAAEMIAIAHRHGARVLVDGAQAVSHMPVDVQALDADFYVFSGHKVFGPTGIGAVYGRSEELAAMPPWQGGGSMIEDVTFEKSLFMPPPERFEAGTGNIADAVGLGAALDYVERIGMSNIAAYEHELLDYATQHLLTVPGLRLIGTAHERAGAISLVLDGCRTQDVGKALDLQGIAVRAGHHCAQPILRRFGLEATVRPSLALYNTPEDIDALVTALVSIATRRAQRH